MLISQSHLAKNYQLATYFHMENFVSFVKNTVEGAMNAFSSNNNNNIKYFKMHDLFAIESDITNGLCFNGVYLPQEIVIQILSLVEPKQLLRCSLVCKQWCNLIKSTVVWQEIYNRIEYPKKALNLPWYVYYCYFSSVNFTNLLKNGNGQLGFTNWRIIQDGGDKFKIEKNPVGSPPLPVDVSDFNGYTSCFVTSYQGSFKIQEIHLSNIMRYIIHHHKPTLYVSEWYTGRHDCACFYALSVICLTPEQQIIPSKEIELFRDTANVRSMEGPYFRVLKRAQIEQWACEEWKKIEIIAEEYEPNIDRIIFGHCGRDLQFWAGHYGSKMAGGVVRFLFESIKTDNEDNLTLDET